MKQRELAKKIAFLRELGRVLQNGGDGPGELVSLQREPLRRNADQLLEVADDLWELLPDIEVKVEAEEKPEGVLFEID